MNPSDLCRWCGHERREHGYRPEFGTYVSGCAGGEARCPCTRFRRTWSWMRRRPAGQVAPTGLVAGPDLDE